MLITIIINSLLGVHHCPSLWAGTNAGHIYVFYLTIPDAEKRTEEEVQVEIGKEIKLKHKAPVVSMFVVDKDGMPLLGDVMEDQGKGNIVLVFGWDLNCSATAGASFVKEVFVSIPKLAWLCDVCIVTYRMVLKFY